MHGPADGEAPNQPLQELFRQCEENARATDRKSYEQFLSWVAGELTFSEAALWQVDPALDAAPSQDDSEELKTDKIIHAGGRYCRLRGLLKEHRSRNELWILLALWLRQEGICEPLEFLPEELYKKLTRERRDEFGISITDQQHYDRVEAWKPYFERLLKDYRRVEKNRATAKLISDGYDELAITAVGHHPRSPVAAICEWLASRGQGDEGTLRNAHSRVSRKLHKIESNNL